MTDLRPGDFGKLRVKAAKRYGPFALAKMIQMAKTLFAFGYKLEMLAVPKGLFSAPNYTQGLGYGDQTAKRNLKAVEDMAKTAATAAVGGLAAAMTFK